MRINLRYFALVPGLLMDCAQLFALSQSAQQTRLLADLRFALADAAMHHLQQEGVQPFQLVAAPDDSTSAETVYLQTLHALNTTAFARFGYLRTLAHVML